MADGPEVVPGSLTPDHTPAVTPAISPAPIAPTVVNRDEKSPGPPYHSIDQAAGSPGGDQSTSENVSNEKEFLDPDETRPKHAFNEKEFAKPDESNHKYAIEEQDRTTPKFPVEDEASTRNEKSEISPDTDFAGCRGIDGGGQEEQSPVDQRRTNTEDGGDWHSPLFGCCNDGSANLCFESAFMPCILAGRRHLRVKNTKPIEMTSTNTYCLSCFLFTIPLIPFWWVMGMTTRREVRYRYGIKGSNKEDCMTSCFCAWCALVQEEKELLWQEDQRVGSGLDEGYKRTGEQMVYSPTSQNQ